MAKLLCLVCMNEESVPRVGHGAGVPNREGSMIECPEGDPETHAPLEMPLHCGKPMRYFEDEDVDQYRVCPD